MAFDGEQLVITQADDYRTDTLKSWGHGVIPQRVQKFQRWTEKRPFEEESQHNQIIPVSEVVNIKEGHVVVILPLPKTQTQIPSS